MVKSRRNASSSGVRRCCRDESSDRRFQQRPRRAAEKWRLQCYAGRRKHGRDESAGRSSVNCGRDRAPAADALRSRCRSPWAAAHHQIADAAADRYARSSRHPAVENLEHVGVDIGRDIECCERSESMVALDACPSRVRTPFPWRRLLYPIPTVPGQKNLHRPRHAATDTACRIAKLLTHAHSIRIACGVTIQ